MRKLYTSFWLALSLIFFTLVITSACVSQSKKAEHISFAVTIIDKGKDKNLYQILYGYSPELITSDVTCPTWAPNKTYIAYSSLGDIFIEDLNSRSKKLFEIKFESLSQPVWSPKGDRLAFKGVPRTETTESIWLMDTTTGELEKISSCEENERDCFISTPDWSNSNKLAYGVRINGQQSLIEYDPSTSKTLISHRLETILRSANSIFGNNGITNNIRVLEQASSELAWSPDGIYLAIVDNGIRSNVKILNTQTQEIVSVTQNLDLSVAFDSPTWSSDGQWLLLRKLRLRQYDFWETVGYDIVLTHIPSGLSRGSFSFDIIYESDKPLICPGNLVVEE